jgi:hypothetical protein
MTVYDAGDLHDFLRRQAGKVVRHTSYDETADYTLEVTIPRRGHAPPIPNGAMVRCVYDGGSVYMDLDPDLGEPSRRGDERSLPMKRTMSGVVVDRVWHVDHYELMKAEIDPVLRSNRQKPALKNVFQNLHYRVMFSQGLYWARFDWVEEVD